MSISKNKKSDIIKDFGKNGKDSGSPNVQAAILTERIKNLTDHLKTHSKDFSTRRGLLTLVGKRRRVLDYIKNKNEENYKNISSINLLNDYINKELTQHEETSYCSLNNLLIDTNIDNFKIGNLGLFI